VNNHPAPEKPKEESEYRDTLILNYYNDRDMCIKFIPGNYLNENVIMTICDEMDTDTIWHIAKEGDTKIIENFYEDTCILLDENGLAYADGCENGAVFKDIMTTFNKDAIQSDAFPDKCLKPVASDFDPYGITIFTEDRGVRVMMDDCDYSDKYQHWRFREVPEHEYENVEYIYITETTANSDETITTELIENELPNDNDEYVFTSIVEDENPSEAFTEDDNIDDVVEVFVTENDLPSEVIIENEDADEVETDVITENIDVDEVETDAITEIEKVDEKETSRPKKSPLSATTTELIKEEYTDLIYDDDLNEEERVINKNERDNEEYSGIVTENIEDEEYYGIETENIDNEEYSDIVTESIDDSDSIMRIIDNIEKRNDQDGEDDIIIDTFEEEEILYDKYDQVVDLNEYIECTYNVPVITSTKKVWIYNEELNLCITSQGRYKQPVWLEKCNENNYGQLWYVPDNNNGYYVNVGDEDISIIYTPMQELIFDGYMENIPLEKNHVKNHSSIITYEDGLLRIYDKFHDEEVCFNVTEEEKSKKTEILVNMVPCNKTTTRWIVTAEYPLA